MGRYLLSYANVPFDMDDAEVINLDMAPDGTTSISPPNIPDTIKPMSTFLEELDRLMPFDYLEDFEGQGPFPGRALAGIAHSNSSSTRPNPQVKIGEWYYPYGANRWSVFRGLMTESKVAAIMNATGGRTATTFIMKTTPEGAGHDIQDKYTLESQMFVLPPRIIAQHGGRYDGLYIVTLVDERYWWADTKINLTITPSTTWTDLLSLFASTLGISLSLVSPIADAYSQPEPDSPMWAQSSCAATLFEAVCQNIGKVLVRNLGGTYQLLNSTESLARVTANRTLVAPFVRFAGGDMFSEVVNSRQPVAPESYTVAFPKYVRDNDPVPHYLNARYAHPRPSAWIEDGHGSFYEVTVPILSGGIIGVQGRGVNVVQDSAKALFSGEINAGGFAINHSGLVALSMQMARDYYGAQLAAGLDETYPGTRNISPEGIHDILWTYSARAKQGSTKVYRTEWNTLIRTFQHAAPPVSGDFGTRGMGGPSVAQSWRDSSDLTIITTLGQSLGPSIFTATVSSVANLPKDRRWKGQIDGEIILFEGTNDSTTLTIVYRGYDGTVDTAHNNGSILTLLAPQSVHGANLVTWGTNQFIYPAAHTSGGIQEVYAHPQTQNVFTLAGSGSELPQQNRRYYSGQLYVFNPANGTFEGLEHVWITERNNGILLSGTMYDGTFAGYSPSPVNPVYLTNLGGIDGVMSGGGSPTPSPSSGSPPIVPGGSVKYERLFKDDPADSTYVLSTSPTDRDNRCVGNWYFGGEPERAGSVTLTSIVPSTNLLHAMPFLEIRGRNVESIAYWLVSALTGGVVRIGIYTNRSDGDLYPDLLVFDSGDLDAEDSDNEGLVTVEVCRTLSPYNLYWLVFLCNSASESVAPPVKGVSTNELWGLNGTFDNWLSNGAESAWGAAFTYAALPERFPNNGASVGGGVTVPAVGIRYGVCCIAEAFYCVDLGNGCEVVFVDGCSICNEEKTEFDDAICDGPFDTFAEALTACEALSPPPGPPGDQTITCNSIGTTLPGTYTLDWRQTVDMANPNQLISSCTMTYNSDLSTPVTGPLIWRGTMDDTTIPPNPTVGCGPHDFLVEQRVSCTNNLLVFESRSSCDNGTTWSNFNGGGSEIVTGWEFTDPGFAPGGGNCGVCGAVLWDTNAN